MAKRTAAPSGLARPKVFDDPSDWPSHPDTRGCAAIRALAVAQACDGAVYITVQYRKGGKRSNLLISRANARFLQSSINWVLDQNFPAGIDPGSDLCTVQCCIQTPDEFVRKVSRAKRAA